MIQAKSKRTRLKDATVQSLDIPIRRRIMDRMEAALHAYYGKFKKNPEAFLLGPKEFLAFQAATHAEPSYTLTVGSYDRASFAGIPVELKMQPGIDFRVETHEAAWLLEL